MKQHHVFIATSLDGYIADAQGGVGFMDTFPMRSILSPAMSTSLGFICPSLTSMAFVIRYIFIG